MNKNKHARRFNKKDAIASKVFATRAASSMFVQLLRMTGVNSFCQQVNDRYCSYRERYSRNEPGTETVCTGSSTRLSALTGLLQESGPGLLHKRRFLIGSDDC